jgi:hypothetical protein
MADSVTSRIVHDGPHKAVMRFTNESDGVGESAVTKVDVSTLSGIPSEAKISWIKFATQGMAVKIMWDAVTDVLAYNCPADMAEEVRFDPPLTNNSGAGKTGDILFTTVGHSSGDSYAIELGLIKKA